MTNNTRELRALAKTLLALVAFLLLAASQLAAQTTTIILVRHTEKTTEEKDPALTEEGTRRAEALAAALADTRVDAIYITQYQRTSLTAAPLATRRQLTPTVITAGVPDHPRNVATRLLENERGRTVLVVGHSNTIPAIIAALGGPAVTIADAEHDHLFVLQIDGSGGVSFIRGKY